MGLREEVLDEILALLVLMAALADRVAGRPFAVALPVMAGLAQVEALARGYVIRQSWGAPALFAASRAEDRATRLAADLRMLVRILRSHLAQVRRRPCPGVGVLARSCARVAALRLVPAGDPIGMQPAPDTS